jgi:membrane protease YdiL (CAAX protease family)
VFADAPLPPDAKPAPPRGRAAAAILDALRTFCVASAALMAVALVARFLLPWLTGIEPDSQNLVKDVVSGPSGNAVLIAVFGVLVAPFTEECIFRGMLYPALRRFGPGLAALLSALVFAALHVNKKADIYSFVPLFVLAVLLARLYERRSSLLATTTVHVLNNATTLIPLLLLRP